MSYIGYNGLPRACAYGAHCDAHELSEEIATLEGRIWMRDRLIATLEHELRNAHDPVEGLFASVTQDAALVVTRDMDGIAIEHVTNAAAVNLVRNVRRFLPKG